MGLQTGGRTGSSAGCQCPLVSGLSPSSLRQPRLRSPVAAGVHDSDSAAGRCQRCRRSRSSSASAVSPTAAGDFVFAELAAAPLDGQTLLRSLHRLTRCRPSPCTRLSRARSTTAAPPRSRLRPTSGLSRHRAPGRRAAGIDRGRFPRSLPPDRRVRHPALPLRHRHGYAVVLHRGLRTQSVKTRSGVAHLPMTRGRVRAASQPESTGLGRRCPTRRWAWPQMWWTGRGHPLRRRAGPGGLSRWRPRLYRCRLLNESELMGGRRLGRSVATPLCRSGRRPWTLS